MRSSLLFGPLLRSLSFVHVSVALCESFHSAPNAVRNSGLLKPNSWDRQESYADSELVWVVHP